MDHQHPCAQQMFGVFGFTDIQSVLIEPTWAATGEVSSTIKQAIERAQELAKSL